MSEKEPVNLELGDVVEVKGERFRLRSVGGVVGQPSDVVFENIIYELQRAARTDPSFAADMLDIPISASGDDTSNVSRDRILATPEDPV